jgi:hypothetical protein
MEERVESRDIDWLVPLALIMAFELALSRSFPIGNLLPTYALFAVAASLIFALIAAARLLFSLYAEGEQHPISRLGKEAWNARMRIGFLLAGLVSVTFSACAITALKSGIQRLVPFYADPALADFDRLIFGEDAWRFTNALFGWTFPLVSTIYGTWLFGQTATLTGVLFAPPSKWKTQALLTHALIWLLLGIVLAYAFSSAGPIFYDQVYGGARFAELRQLMESSTLTAAPQQYLWQAHQSGNLDFAAGISAMPSLHLAGATWLALVIGGAFPRLKPALWVYVALIYLGSLMTGWHYSLDGFVGITGAALIWKAAGRLATWRSRVASFVTPALQPR